MGRKVGEVSCGFRFIVLPLRGAGTGGLLTVLGRGGKKGESSGGQTIRHDTDSKSRRLRADRTESRHGKRSETPLPEFGSERRTKRGRKTTRQFRIKEALASAASLQGQVGQQGGRTDKTLNQQTRSVSVNSALIAEK